MSDIVLSLPPPPPIAISVVRDRSPSSGSDTTPGFLDLARVDLVATFGAAGPSEPFTYDFVRRAALDSVVMAAHFERDGTRFVYLRSAIRPPLVLRPIAPVHDGALWEVPAGLIDPGESPEQAAQRELGEELGFDVAESQLVTLGASAFPCPGTSGERMSFFHVEVDPMRRRVPSEDGSTLEKDALVLAVPLTHAVEECRRGGIPGCEDRAHVAQALGGGSVNAKAEGDERDKRNNTNAGASVVVFVKRTSYGKLALADHDPRIEQLLAEHDITVRRMRRSHEDHEATVEEAEAAVDKLGLRATFVRGPRTAVEGRFDLVVTIGGDGTLLAASHGVGPGVPLLGINSAPNHSVGFFCGAKKGEVYEALGRALEGKMRSVELSRLRVDQNGALLHARVLNEILFCHACPAATSRYILRVLASDGSAGIVAEEEQRSSGIWIGPAAGSTAAQKSAGGRVLPLASNAIQFVVREPYTPIGVPLHLGLGLIENGQVIEVRNKMRESKVFVDGHHVVFDATIGDVLTMRRSEESLTVLGLTRNGL